MNRDKKIVVRCDEDFLKKLELISKRNRRSKSDMVRELVYREYEKGRNKNDEK